MKGIGSEYHKIMVSNDSLVRKRWVEWKEFNEQWGSRSFDDFEKWLEYRDKISIQVQENAIKWNIFINHEKEQSVSFTAQFRSYWKPLLKFLLDANEKTLDSIPPSVCMSFIEYGFVQIISKFIGIEDKQYFNLPRRDPDKLRQIFEISELVFRLLDNDINHGCWEKMGEAQDEMIRERMKFKEGINKNNE
jgi:hypothetical protein